MEEWGHNTVATSWNFTAFHSSQFVALPCGLCTAPRVFTKVLALLLGLLCTPGYYCYRVPELLASEGCVCLSPGNQSVSHGAQTGNVWMGSELQKSTLVPTQRLTYLGLTLDSIQMKIILLLYKCLAQSVQVDLLNTLSNPSICFCSRVLGKTLFEAVPFAQFCSRPIPLWFMTCYKN